MRRLFAFVFLAVTMPWAAFAQAPAATESPVEATTADSTAASKPERAEPAIIDWQGSVLFDPETITRLRRALQLYQGSAAQIQDIYPDLGGTAPTNTDLVLRAPYFYLGSIIYPSSGEWFIWLNGKKIVASRPTDDPRLSIDAITPAAVTFSWRPETTKDINEHWRRRKEIDAYLGRQPSNVHFDEPAGIVTFTLRPNQTFFSQTMEVAEGRIPPSERLPKGFGTQDKPTITEGAATVSTQPDAATPPPDANAAAAGSETIIAPSDGPPAAATQNPVLPNIVLPNAASTPVPPAAPLVNAPLTGAPAAASGATLNLPPVAPPAPVGANTSAQPLLSLPPTPPARP